MRNTIAYEWHDAPACQHCGSEWPEPDADGSVRPCPCGDESILVELPARWAICWRCRGDGVHDHPAFSNGLTAEDFAEDPDFAEDYYHGNYDVPCSECGGSGKLLELDRKQCPPDVLESYDGTERARAECEAEAAAERRMGA